MNNKVKVWDISTRLFHWGMIGLLAGLWWSADAGELVWHQVLAYSLMVLIVFRIIWGLVGSDTAKFSHFIKHPKTVFQYVGSIKRHGVSSSVGHNPLGGYMVIALIAVVTLQLSTGLFATDEIFTEGPLYSYVASDTALWLTWLHKQTFNIILLLASIHVLAVLVHTVKGDKLILPMITGYKNISEAANVSLGFRSVFIALALFSALATLVGNYLIWPMVQML
ncbi:cytochrome b/b6 domain-containing protein [Shewanella eurypsychrophilus]|uniref:Cytochrome b/b6 domain-containing protein n=1 Tax=Shewanella eurypsychrophilus TaxID=2593656 RepID=A0ABX6V327_9GAMM|nr:MULTISPECIES: cytochrome b/b6 domain-containing protein [Shewanella]QFU21754.1 cytochrome B [Shewanella sp. YLB-09]QPG57044.1 cytochrome b/b6 domain-containing protein [Shewanella eurypsychrophilus]